MESHVQQVCQKQTTSPLRQEDTLSNVTSETSSMKNTSQSTMVQCGSCKARPTHSTIQEQDKNSEHQQEIASLTFHELDNPTLCVTGDSSFTDVGGTQQRHHAEQLPPPPSHLESQVPLENSDPLLDAKVQEAALAIQTSLPDAPLFSTLSLTSSTSNISSPFSASPSYSSIASTSSASTPPTLSASASPPASMLTAQPEIMHENQQISEHSNASTSSHDIYPSQSIGDGKPAATHDAVDKDAHLIDATQSSDRTTHLAQETQNAEASAKKYMSSCDSCCKTAPISTLLHVGELLVCATCEPLFRSRASATLGRSVRKSEVIYSQNVKPLKRRKSTTSRTQASAKKVAKKTVTSITHTEAKKSTESVEKIETPTMETSKKRSPSPFVEKPTTGEVTDTVASNTESCESCGRTSQADLVSIRGTLCVCLECEPMFRAYGASRRASRQVQQNMSSSVITSGKAKKQASSSSSSASTSRSASARKKRVESSISGESMSNMPAVAESQSVGKKTSVSTETTAGMHDSVDNASSSMSANEPDNAGESVPSQSEVVASRHCVCCSRVTERKTSHSMDQCPACTTCGSSVRKHTVSSALTLSRSFVPLPSNEHEQNSQDNTKTQGPPAALPESDSVMNTCPISSEPEAKAKPKTMPTVSAEQTHRLSKSRTLPPCESCGKVTANGLQHVGQLMVCAECAIVFNPRRAALAANTVSLETQVLVASVSDTPRKAKQRVRKSKSISTGLPDDRLSKPQSPSLSSKQTSAKAENDTQTSTRPADPTCECCNKAVALGQLMHVGRLLVCVNCVPLFRSRAAAQTRLLAGRVKHSDSSQLTLEDKPAVRDVHKRKHSRRGSFRCSSSFSAAEKSNEMEISDADSVSGSKKEVTSEDTTDTKSTATEMVASIRCESCSATPDTVQDATQRFSLVGSLVLCSACEPLFATGLRRKRRALLAPEATSEKSADVASKRVKLHTSVSSDTMNKDAVKGSAWHRKSAKKQKASSASSTPVEQTSSDESMKTLSADVQGDDMADTKEEPGALYCVQCRMVIRQFRYYCTYCEVTTEDNERKSFELCISCFANFFPWHHQHPRSSFAEQCVLDEATITSVSTARELALRYEEDQFDLTFDATKHNLDPTRTLEEFSAVSYYDVSVSDGNGTTIAFEDNSNGYAFLERWAQRRRCALCNDDEVSETLGDFVGPYPFLMPDHQQTGRRTGDKKTNGEKANNARNRFWVHDACARFSPEVYVTASGRWYNVAAAVRRGKKLRCIVCQERGATIGCFEPKCRRSFHVGCSGKPIENFKRGIVFWCPQHEARNNKYDAYIDIYSCDGCRETLEDEWFSCTECEDFFQTYDLCLKCFEQQKCDWSHVHESNKFIRKSKEALMLQANSEAGKSNKRSTKKSRSSSNIWSGMRGVRSGRITRCSYCWTDASPTWRKIFHGVLVCERCFASSSGVSSTNYNKQEITEQMAIEADDERSASETRKSLATTVNSEDYVGDVDDYMHNPYLTRRCYTDGRFEETRSNAQYLDSYGPEEHQMYSLPHDSTYYDIPGRAPRWATHSGTDYHGTWLPHTVRRSLLRYTRKNDRVLSNFLGRGTDAIESFLLHRRCVGVDINPTAIALSQKNCSFAIPPEFGITGEMRPIILKADARYLSGPHFADESFDHVLSHPPYKDCVEYSAGLQGDLSRFANSQDFYREMGKVARTAWRLLKMGARCTIGIGDNREFCFYIPVGFELLRTYLNNGYMLEELVVKRQRYCSAFGLGTFLCVQYDFLCFTHEFIIIMRKMPKTEDYYICNAELDESTFATTETLRRVPALPIQRQSVIMGTVWTFRTDTPYTFPDLCMSRMVERFGKDDTNWREIRLYPVTHKEQSALTLKSAPIELKDNDKSSGTAKNSASDYENQRKKQILENNQMLMSLGLITDLGDDANDIPHLEKLIRDAAPNPDPNTPLTVVVVPHLEDTDPKRPHLATEQDVAVYRKHIIKIARRAYEELCVSGFFIVGVKDVRIPRPDIELPDRFNTSSNEAELDPDRTESEDNAELEELLKDQEDRGPEAFRRAREARDARRAAAAQRVEKLLYPMGMLVLEDMNREFSDDRLKLKELVVTVPNGYARDPHNWDRSYQELHIDDLPPDSPQRYLPIVHAYYLVFMKLA